MRCDMKTMRGRTIGAIFGSMAGAALWFAVLFIMVYVTYELEGQYGMPPPSEFFFLRSWIALALAVLAGAGVGYFRGLLVDRDEATLDSSF